MKKVFCSKLFIVLIAIVVALIVLIIKYSNSLSYLSKDSGACINCHIMDSYYASWQHSSHKNVAQCIQCHLPTDNIVHEYYEKAVTGVDHTFHFIIRAEGQVPRANDSTKRMIEKNCIACHRTKVHNLTRDGFNANKTKGKYKVYCWDCHRGVPHGIVRSLSATPNNIGVKYIQDKEK